MIIDADSHVEEGDAVWAALEPAYAMRRPMVMRRPEMTGPFAQNSFWLIDGQACPRPYGLGPSLYGTPVDSTFARSKPFAIDSQTLDKPELRLADMDRFGVDVQVLFSTIFLDYLTPDAGFEAALMRSYNTWLAAACATHPKRLKWVAPVPFRVPAEAVAEVKRVKALGASGILAYGTAGDQFLHEAMFDPVWAEIARQDMAVAMHVGWNMRSLHSKMDSLLMSTTLVAMPMMFGLYSMIGGGILERFPTLRVGFFEAGADWLPYFLPRIERYWKIYAEKGWPGAPKTAPGEWLKRGNIYFTCEGDERYLNDVAELLGEDRLMTSADMPHEEALENSIRHIQERADLPDRLRQKILSDNPARFFGF